MVSLSVLETKNNHENFNNDLQDTRSWWNNKL